jgi:two-component sensor histidine kinase
MSLFADLLADCPGIDETGIDHLQLLLADWQILADLSFADLLLWVRTELPTGQPGYKCVGQMRPYTAQTIYHEDMVGTVFPAMSRPMVGRAYAERRVIRDADPDWSTGVPVREEAIPVCFRDDVLAVVTREANVSTARSPSQLELTYLQSAGELAQMLADGTFPYPSDTFEEREVSPRVGDGLLRLDMTGRVVYASPNAVSAYRRLGVLDVAPELQLEAFDPSGDELLDGLRLGEPVETEVEREGSIVVRRVLPLLAENRVTAGLMLVREVTDLRRQERALRLKDATIREIHHRVKNNLQTVASLLRLQSRRLRSEEARSALAESVRRISSIALVHETLSQETRQRVHFAKVSRRIIHMLADGLVGPDTPIAFKQEGDPGELSAEVATPLALVLTELLQNSVEHGFPMSGTQRHGGEVLVSYERGLMTLRVVVHDSGVGLPEGESLDTIANLGLQIARTLVETELAGSFTSLEVERGTAIELVVPLQPRV